MLSDTAVKLMLSSITEACKRSEKLENRIDDLLQDLGDGSIGDITFRGALQSVLRDEKAEDLAARLQERFHEETREEGAPPVAAALKDEVAG
jgi:hypothetical protein